MRNVSDETRGKIKTQFYTQSEYRAVYEKMWKSMVQSDRPQMAKEHGSKRFDLLCR
jgi:hypothetical protein